MKLYINHLIPATCTTAIELTCSPVSPSEFDPSPYFDNQSVALTNDHTRHVMLRPPIAMPVTDELRHVIGYCKPIKVNPS